MDFETIVPAAQAGDQKARDELMKGFYGWTVSQARLYVNDFDTAANIAVLVWERLLTENRLAQYDPAKGSFFGWLKAIVANAAVDELRRPTLDETPDAHIEDAPGSAPLTEAFFREGQDAIRAALTKQERRAFDVILDEGADAAAIAWVMDVSPANAWQLLSRVRSKAREVLE
jgi:RNA polymerase sigma factor (sigma-70 family)